MKTLAIFIALATVHTAFASDYCEVDLSQNSVTVQRFNPSGTIVKTDLSGEELVKELALCDQKLSVYILPGGYAYNSFGKVEKTTSNPTE